MLLCVALGCDESGSKAPTPGGKTPSDKQEAQASPAKGSSAGVTRKARPKQIDAALTEERRRKISDSLSQVKDFLVASEIEQTLKDQKEVKTDEVAIKAFDAEAAGKWVLFTGPMNKIDRDGFELAVTYARKSKKDPFGMSRMWFNVRFEEVSGYSPVTVAEGHETAVLGKYKGNGVAAPAYDLVALGLW